MSLATLNFAATLPTYVSQGSNGTVFADDTLAASGNVLIDTNDATTGQPSVLASGLSANGLTYNFNSYSLSGDTLSVFYNLSSDAGTSQQNEGADIYQALSDNLPENQTDFTYAGGVKTGNLTSSVYNDATVGVNGIVPTTTSEGAATVVGTGTSIALQSIAATSDTTLEVVYTINTGQAQTAPASTSSAPSTAAGNTLAVNAANGSASTVGLLAGNLLTQNTNQALGPTTIAQLIGQNTNETNPGTLLAGLLNPLSAQQLSIYNVVTAFGSAQTNTVNAFA